jgi:8-oxo-dGTP pyrophosphatase MutT (NUDIX family)
MAGVAIREAATVVLLRDGPNGLETWLLRRMPKMAFAAGMSVFPGGAVDADDSPDFADSAELAPVAEQLGTSVAHAGRLVCAAIRETLEEVGVLLVQPPVQAEQSTWAAVDSGNRTFSSMLTELGVQLDIAAVRPWARWITPEGESRRYDTYFFVAVVPPGAVAAAITSEASHADWIAIDAALAEFNRGERPMLPPTITTLTEIAKSATAAEVLEVAGRRRIEPVQPVFRREPSGQLVADLGNGTVIALPDDFLSATGKQL